MKSDHDQKLHLTSLNISIGLRDVQFCSEMFNSFDHSLIFVESAIKSCFQIEL